VQLSNKLPFSVD